MKTSASVFGIICSLVFTVASCDYESTVNIEPTQKEKGIKTNQPPTLAYIETEFDTVAVCNNLELTCIVEVPENDSCTYEWESFKVTEESTEEDYHFDYFMNKGEFTQAGKTALWKPGKLDGKYLLLCIAKDKGGYEIVAKKIVNVNLEGCLSLTTDKTIYQPFDFYEVSERYLTLTISNKTNYMVIPRSFGEFITAVLQKNIENKWSSYSNFEDTSGILILEPGEEYENQWENPYEEGIYRFYVLYKTEVTKSIYTDTLFSNEFKVAK